MKKWQKHLSLFLSACLLCTLFSACGNSGSPAPGQDPGTPEAGTNAGEAPDLSAPEDSEDIDPYGPVGGERVTIHIGRPESSNVNYEPGEDSYNNYIVKYLEEKLNVEYIYDFSTDETNRTYETKVSMVIASGDIPDVMNVTYAQLRQLVEAGAVEDMTETMRTYASPGLRRAFDSTQGISFDLASFGGKLMAIPNISPGMDSVPILFLRGDWMDELGLDAPETLDDIATIVKTFKEKNPGGNVNAGLVCRNDIVQLYNGNYYMNALFNSQGAYPKLWVDMGDNTVGYGSVQPEMKEALATIRGLVEDGVIDPSFAVRDETQCRELIFSGQAGAFFGAWWGGQAVVDMLVAEDDSVRWDMYLAPVNSSGKVSAVMKSPSDSYVVVKAGSSPEIKEAVVKTINYQYDLDQDQAMDVRPNGMDTNFSWHYFPLNLLHCDYDAKERQIQDMMDVIDGKLDYDDQCGDGKTWYNGYTTVLEKGFREAANENLSTANAWGWARGAWVVQSNEDRIERIFGATYAESPTMESKWSTLKTLEDETFLQILTGDADVDAFDGFVEQWYALGGDVITLEMTGIANS